MAKTIAFVNQKGGVGKTTSCVSLGSCLQAAGARVLVCDFDPQGNATSGFGVDKGAVFPTIYDVLINGASVEKAIVHTKYADVLPANKALAGASVELIGMDRREYLLKEALGKVAGNYDFVLIDCPPSLELLTLNRPVCGGHGAGAGPVRILCPGRAERPALDRSGGQAPPESAALSWRACC